MVHIAPTGRHGHHATIREQRSDHDRDARAVSRPDAGRSDSERHNSGRHDAEPNDAGRRDAEHRDAGRNDSERGDSGSRDAGDSRIVRWQKPQGEDHEQPSNSINQDRSDDRFQHRSDDRSQHRSDDRSEHSRRSTMTERPQNIRPARTTDRTQNSRRTSESRWDEPQSSSRSYHGSHRAPSMHHADDGQSAAHDRISRVGRHHASRHEEHSNRR
jgi:hypothetical protein